MYTQLCVAMVLVGVAVSTPSDLYSASRPSYRPPHSGGGGYRGPNHQGGGHQGGGHQGGGYQDKPIPYNFNYGVQDEYAGTNFNQEEYSDGNTVKGSYTVHLPDGRRQTVTYTADDYNGYVAKVEYYGEAQYPQQYGPAVTFKPQYSQASYQPSYH